jgi:hypothetical protein
MVLVHCIVPPRLSDFPIDCEVILLYSTQDARLRHESLAQRNVRAAADIVWVRVEHVPTFLPRLSFRRQTMEAPHAERGASFWYVPRASQRCR